MHDPAAATDDMLLAAAARGDEAAFARLLERHGKRALAVATRFLGSASDAEEVVQEAFWRVWSTAGRWRPGEAAFPTWLHRVVVNLCIDRERRAKLRRFFSLEAVPEPAEEAAPADRQVEAAGELAQVMADIRRLPGKQRAALLLAASGEHSNQAIATMLGVSEKAVESLLVRARRSLRSEARRRLGEEQ
ncbi:MAG TPA: sigma-70 family RNA polymerase sigma factor [Hyphomicrobiales bacterium]|nr:sigma-70 family RNA polymerase sigma factor [Hyphomicrobiales bacterium]